MFGSRSPKRNTGEIVRLSREKALKTRDNAEKVLSRMTLEGKTINFNTVSKEAGVSKSWFYKEPEIRKRIESIRGQQQKSLNGALKLQKQKSLKSEEVLIKNLKGRVKVLEEENLLLKKQIQKLYGELYSKKG
ncbi:DUF6262 family protein [Parageobacillus sp. G301]|uniref:DUF6262 family protein n=1 Tax=Parageobacillus sp. G301 TaxID=2998290 RepID=UPI002554E1EF|nr:DUF6262 family protein [Parageobacillus sp. G301]